MRSVTVQAVVSVVQVRPPGEAVTVYAVIGRPPVEDGADQVTPAEASRAIAEIPVGAPGRPVGVTATDEADAGLVPAPLVAVTVNVYAVPFVRSVTVQEVASDVQVCPPGDAVTVYERIALPPFEDGVSQLTPAEASYATAAMFPGGVGGVATRTSMVTVTTSLFAS